MKIDILLLLRYWNWMRDLGTACAGIRCGCV